MEEETYQRNELGIPLPTLVFKLIESNKKMNTTNFFYDMIKLKISSTYGGIFENLEMDKLFIFLISKSCLDFDFSF